MLTISNIPPEIYAVALAYERGDLDELPDLAQAKNQYTAFIFQNGWQGGDSQRRFNQALSDFLLRQGHFVKGRRYESADGGIFIVDEPEEE